MNRLTNFVALVSVWLGSLALGEFDPSFIAAVSTAPTAPASTAPAAAGVSSYCTSSTSAFSCHPTMSWAGVPSASAPSGFVLMTSNVDGQRNGAIFYSLLPGNQNLIAGTTSYRCILNTPTQSMGTLNSGGTLGQCNGFLAVDWNAFTATNPTALGMPASVGQTFYAQERHQCPGYWTNRSNGLSFIVGP